eukprot:GHVQ01043075.1.p1 GENE.GHVQ01043075.1~~GHVQ01043075.1.p1  ORF type:complete len:239 (+),score=25.09 GHVQ01043075.1:150-866(+)
MVVSTAASNGGSAMEERVWDFLDDRREFTVTSGDGYELSCAVHLKDNGVSTNKAVVLCHGLFCSKEHRLIQHLSKELGINAVVFDFHGNGHSGGEESWSFGGYESECDKDLREVVSFLRTHGIEVVGIIGHSRAANVVLLYSIKYDDIPLVVSIAARFDMKRGITRHFGEEKMKLLESVGSFEMTPQDGRSRVITKQGIEERTRIDMRKVSEIRKSKLLLAHGKKDAIIPYEVSSIVA